MNRRQLLKGATAASLLTILARSQEQRAAARAPTLIKPRRLRTGDTIGVISPSSGLSATNFERAVRNVEALGFKTKVGRFARGSHGIFSGTDSERLHDLHWAFREPEIHGVWCARGGNGAQRLLPEVDFALIRNNPKVFVGYSDITALHTAIQQQCGLVTFHGPLGISEFSDYTKRHVLNLITNPTAPYRIELSEFNKAQSSELYQTRVITPGQARGRLIGGNLTLLASLSGSRWGLRDTDGKLLFVETVDDSPWNIERKVTQLRHSIDMKKLAGVAVGVLEGCLPSEKQPSPPVFEIIRQHLSGLGIPAIYGLSFGHIRDQFTLPIGIEAELDTASTTITLLETGVT